MARPSSARAAPPRLKAKEEEIITPVYDVLMIKYDLMYGRLSKNLMVYVCLSFYIIWYCYYYNDSKLPIKHQMNKVELKKKLFRPQIPTMEKKPEEEDEDDDDDYIIKEDYPPVEEVDVDATKEEDNTDHGT